MSSTSRPPELQAIIDEIGRAGPFASVEEVNRLFALRVREYNATPQAVLIPRYRNPPYSIRRSRFGIKVNALARPSTESRVAQALVRGSRIQQP